MPLQVTPQMLAALFVAALLASGVAEAQVTKEEITAPSRHRGKEIILPAEAYFPDQTSQNLPAMVIWHDSGGLQNEHEYAYARELVKIGVVAVIPDSFTPRGIKNTIIDQSQVNTPELSIDAFRLLRKLQQHPRIDPSRIGIMGFSKGATLAVGVSLNYYGKHFTNPKERYALHVALYPNCSTQYLDTKMIGGPLYMILGEADTYTPMGPCIEFGGKLRAAGGRVEIFTLPKAKHSWDTGTRDWEITGDNFGGCILDQQSDLSFIERKSGIMVYGPGTVMLPDQYAKAMKVCQTWRISGGPNAEATKRGKEIFREAMRHHLGIH